LGYFSGLTIVIVASRSDTASQSMASSLIEEHDFKSTGIVFQGEYVYARGNMLLVYIQEEPVYPPDLDKFFNPYSYIFLSRHSSSSMIPSVTVHSTGNLGEAKLGGKDFEIAKTEPSIIKNLMISLSRKSKELTGYRITLEATHHGPTSLSKPCVFLEIGSSDKEWKDRNTANTVCDALIESLEKGDFWEKVCVAFGGTHYPDKFNRWILESEYTISYIVPRYALGLINQAILEQMIKKTVPQAGYALLDWKGLGSEKEKLIELLNRSNLEVIKL
jgi:D-aminoacyl-tRNA deacylase